jgi:hypothetical protein
LPQTASRPSQDPLYCSLVTVAKTVERCPIHTLALLWLSGCNPTDLSKVSLPPSVSIDNPPDGSTLSEGVTVELSGIITDSYYRETLDQIVVTWAVDGGKICEDAIVDTNGRTTCDHIFDEGTSTISLTAVNPNGDKGVAESTVTVAKNDAPSGSIISPVASGSYYSDHDVEFLATVADTEDDPDQLTVTFESTLDGLLNLPGVPTSDGQFSGTVELSEGDHFITMVITDTSGRTGQDTVSISVNGANNPPTCAILSPENYADFGVNETILFEATANDLDIDASQLAVTFTSDKDGVIGNLTPSSNGNVQFGINTLSTNTHTITMLVEDEIGSTCTDVVLLTVGNAPDLEITAPTSGTVINEGERANFSALVTDVEDRSSDIVVDWESSIDGVLFSQNASSSGVAEFSIATLSRGTHSITASGTDSDGLTGRDSITLYVNGLPEAPTVAITPASPGSGDDLRATVTADAYDPENDPITYNYEWYKNGVLTANTSNTVPALDTLRGESWEVKVTPNDGYGDGVPGFASVNISNGPPSITNVTIDPNVAYTDDELTAVPVGWYDPDGDREQYRYQWYLNGAALNGSTDPTLAEIWFVKGDQVYVEVTPYDGTDLGATVTSGVITIQNSAPTQPVVSVSPEQPETDDELSCVILTYSTDADGDAITYSYAWTNNGSPTAFTTSTVPIGSTAIGETWECRVTATDGTSSSTPGTDSVNVNDYTAPDAPVLSSIDSYRNEDTVTIQGSTEPLLSVTLYINSANGQTTDTTTANAVGSFTFTETLTRGLTYSFYATAEDANNNVSSPSNTISTEACDPYDDYEDSSGYGDSCADPVVDWSTLSDDGSTTISIVGNILDSSDSDWYMIDTSDLGTYGINYYRFHVEMVAGSGHYKFVVYSGGGCSSADLDCSSDPYNYAYTEYEVYQQDQGDHASHATPSDTRTCYNSHGDYNGCDDFSDTYYIQVVRVDSGYDCSYYQLTVTNGKW